jgi:hypothetical protein
LDVLTEKTTLETGNYLRGMYSRERVVEYEMGYGFLPVSVTYSSSNFKHDATLKLKFSNIGQKILALRVGNVLKLILQCLNIT